jgi:hypothetical protein
MIKKNEIPRFNSELEEAEWWDLHREETAEWMKEAAEAGQSTNLSAILECARQRENESAVLSILELDQNDLALIKERAAKRRVTCEAYLRELIHQALERAG